MSLSNKIFNIQQFGASFSDHYLLGQGLIQKGKTKKMKIYAKGFTFNSLFKNKVVKWEDILTVHFFWEEYTVNMGGREKLELNFTLKNNEMITIVFRSPIFILPIDLSSKNRNIIKILKYFSSIYGFRIGSSLLDLLQEEK
tara:strand:+ start:417 stop:839 length:423 start_codon:yes stop_codon:yes gene_type:complete